MQLKTGICEGTETFKGCKKKALIANRTKKLCISCNKKRLVSSKGKVQKLPTGELQIFKEIWNERPHFSQISGKPLGEFRVHFFSHILTKAAYPAFRLNKQNIVLKTLEEHHQWETQAHKLVGASEWAWVFKLKESLKQKYYNVNS